MTLAERNKASCPVDRSAHSTASRSRSRTTCGPSVIAPHSARGSWPSSCRRKTPRASRACARRARSSSAARTCRSSRGAAPPTIPSTANRPIRIAWSSELGYARAEPEPRDVALAAARAFTEAELEVDEATPNLGDPEWILQTLYGGAQAGAHAARSKEQKALMDPALVE